MILDQLKAFWRGQSLFLLDEIARRRSATSNRTMSQLKMCCKGKIKFLVDGTT